MKRKRLKQRKVSDPVSRQAGSVAVLDDDDEFTDDEGKPLTHTLLTPKFIRDFCQLIEEGLAADSVCNYLGVLPSTYYAWLRKGEKYRDAEAGGNADDLASDRPYGVFVSQFRMATAKYLRRIGKRLHKRYSKDDAGSWFQNMEILSRRDRKTWSRDEPAGGLDEQYNPDERFL